MLLPATFGLAVLLIASTALAEERSAQKQFVNHNDSMMVLQIGDALGGVSTLNIHYENPSERMSQLVQRGDLFFDGSIQWDTRKVIGNARVYKWGKTPLAQLELEGWTPTFGRGCEFEEFVWNHNSRLTFEPIYASAPLPPRDIGGLRKGVPLGWVDL